MNISMFYNDGLNEGQVRDEVNIHHTLSYYGGHTYPRWEEFWPIKVTVNDEESVLEADLILAGDEKVFRPFDPPIDHTKPYDVTFMGTPYGAEMRKELLLAVQEKFDLHVWGNNPESWKNWGIKNVHGPAFDQAANEIINQSKIILGVSNCSCEGYWSVRTACVMLAGGFHIVRFTPQMEKECGDGVIYFSDIEDCLKKIEYYLDKDSPCSWQRRIHIQGRANNIAYN